MLCASCITFAFVVRWCDIISQVCSHDQCWLLRPGSSWPSACLWLGEGCVLIMDYNAVVTVEVTACMNGDVVVMMAVKGIWMFKGPSLSHMFNLAKCTVVSVHVGQTSHNVLSLLALPADTACLQYECHHKNMNMVDQYIIAWLVLAHGLCPHCMSWTRTANW